MAYQRRDTYCQRWLMAAAMTDKFGLCMSASCWDFWERVFPEDPDGFRCADPILALMLCRELEFHGDAP